MDGGDETEMQWRQKIKVSQRPWQFGRSNDNDDDVKLSALVVALGIVRTSDNDVSLSTR